MAVLRLIRVALEINTQTAPKAECDKVRILEQLEGA